MLFSKVCDTIGSTLSYKHNFIVEPKNYALAQHAFIKAVTIEKHSAVAWCNLGTLYLHLEEDRLANKAFAQAQRVDPTYVNSWVGQVRLYTNK